MEDNEEDDELAELATKWSVYCAQDAYLSKSSENLEYWEKKLAQDVVSPSVLQSCIQQEMETLSLVLGYNFSGSHPHPTMDIQSGGWYNSDQKLNPATGSVSNYSIGNETNINILLRDATHVRFVGN